MSGLAEARFSSSAAANGRLSTAVIVLISFKGLVVLKDQPVAVSHEGTTPAIRGSITPSGRSAVHHFPGRTHSSRELQLIERTPPRMPRPLRSGPVTGPSPLLRAGPPARPATVLSRRLR